MTPPHRALLAALTALVLAVAAAPAGAATYTVNRSADVPDAQSDGVCDVDTVAAGEQCTLRAAIEESNASASTDDAIRFDPTAMNGAGGRLITLNSSLPSIADQVDIDAGTACGSFEEPCVAVRNFDGAGLLFTLAPGASWNGGTTTKIAKLRLYDATVGVQVLEGTTMWRVQDNLFGTTLDGTTNGIAIGIEIVGTLGEVVGNEFAGAFTGVNILGGPEAPDGGNANALRGNRFGFPYGSDTPTDSSRVATGVRVASIEGDEAAGNSIGGNEAGSATTCDGACNLFAASSSPTGAAITLHTGDALPAGATTITGNFIGVPPTGTTCQGGFGRGVYVGEADNVTIGGSEAARNYIGCVGGPALETEVQADGTSMRFNYLGVMPDGTTPAPLSAADTPTVWLRGEGDLSDSRIGGSGAGGPGVALGGPSDVYGNLIGAIAGNDLGIGGDGVVVAGVGGAIFDNGIGLVGDDGIHVAAGDGAPADNGVRITGNDISENGGHGIHVEGAGDPTGAVIGEADPDPAGTNRISDNDGAGIRIEGDGTDRHAILWNYGSGNGGQFVDLGPEGPGNDTVDGPNEGILGPSIQATATAASGRAEPGAHVLVFGKASSDAGELGDPLGEATADGDGDWSATYAAPPKLDGELVAALQVDDDGNGSELTVATVGGPLSEPADAPPEQPGDGGDDDGGGGPGGDDVPPGIVPPGPGPAPVPVCCAPPPLDHAAIARGNLDRIVAALRRARVRTLRRRGRVGVRGIRAAAPGTVSFQATARAGRPRSAATVTVLKGTVSFTAAGTKRMTIRMTKAGRKIARRARRGLALRTRVTFRGADGRQAGAQRRLRLRR
ncbi:MAG TPA: hypothetical protein VF587_10005 [Solirubrobacteraceae bacterium]